MKLSGTRILGLVIPMVISMSGCLEVDVRTTVSGDGSSERVISMKLPSNTLPAGSFPVGVDSTWRIEWKEIAEKDSKYEYIARKNFPSPEALHLEYAVLPDTAVVGLSVSVAKRFEWFYTYLEYSETYVMRNAFTNVPVSDYMTKEEVERYVHGEKNDTLDRKVSKWDDRNLFEEFYRSLISEAERRNDPALPASLLKAKKEELFSGMVAADSAKEANPKKGADSTKKDADVTGSILKELAKGLGTDAIFKFQPVVEQVLDAIEKKDSERKHPDGWKNTVQMPGLLIEANSGSVEGNTITWEFNSKQIHVGDYLMHASSRVANVWAFVVTGLAALVLVLMAMRTAFHSRR